LYGAEGDWAQLVSSSDGFEGTDLFVSAARPGRYLTIDRFKNEAAWQQFLVTHRDAYQELDALTAGLARIERNLVGPDAD
jgi:quinol monooxygenase YgiN